MKPWHIVVVIAVFLLFFGIPKLPELAKSIGKSLKIFKSETKGLMDDEVRNKADASAGTKLSEEAPQPPRALDGEILDSEASGSRTSERPRSNAPLNPER